MKLTTLLEKLQDLAKYTTDNTEVEIDTDEISIEDVVLNTDNDYDIILIK